MNKSKMAAAMADTRRRIMLNSVQNDAVGAIVLEKRPDMGLLEFFYGPDFAEDKDAAWKVLEDAWAEVRPRFECFGDF